MFVFFCLFKLEFIIISSGCLYVKVLFYALNIFENKPIDSRFHKLQLELISPNIPLDRFRHSNEDEDDTNITFIFHTPKIRLWKKLVPVNLTRTQNSISLFGFNIEGEWWYGTVYRSAWIDLIVKI